MFPIRDTHPTLKTPIINYLIILVNALVFFLQLTSGNFERFIFQYGFIPSEFNFFEPSSYQPILNSMFLHGGFFHILSNMWFLHIFGDNVEDRLGHIPYLLFCLIAGFFATMSQYIFATSSAVPMIGASGAVSGAAGAYFVLFKKSRVQTLVAAFLVWTVVELPASFVLGYWFLVQVFAGLGSLATIDVNQGGIAFFAHIGGFIFGYLIAKSLRGPGATIQA